MVELNIVNFVTIGLIVLAFIMALRWAMKMAGKTSPV